MERLRNKSHRLSCEEHLKNPLYDGRFLRYDLRLGVLAFPVAQQPLVLKAHFPIFKIFAVGPCDVLADALGFGLCEACVNDKIQFAVIFQRVNVLFLKENSNILRDLSAARTDPSHKRFWMGSRRAMQAFRNACAGELADTQAVQTILTEAER